MSRFLIILGIIFFYSSIQAQFNYEVSTLLPNNAGLLDDGLCMDEVGNVYGSHWGSWQGTAGTHVLRYRPNGSYDTLASGFRNPNGLSYRAGKIYLADSGNGRIVEIDTNGTQQVLTNLAGVVNVIPVPGHPDSLIAIIWSGNKVYGIGPSGQNLLAIGSPLNGPAGAIFTPDGRLFVGNFNNGDILEYDNNGGFNIFATIPSGSGFITYSDSAILATNINGQLIHRLPLNGIGTAVIAGSGAAATIDGTNLQAAFNRPNGIVASPSGDTIYVSEFGSKTLRMIVRTPGNFPPPTSIRNNHTKSIKAFCNSNKQLIIQHANTQTIKSLHVVDLKGKLVLQLKNPDTAQLALGIDLSQLGAAVYVVQLLGEQGQPLFSQQVALMR